MTFFGHYSSVILLLLVSPRCFETYLCHQCNVVTYNYPVTIDTLPSPTEDACAVVSTIHGCSIHVTWNADGSSDVYYRLDPPSSVDNLFVVAEYQLDFSSGEHRTQRSIGYSCRSTTTPCNTIERLKRAMLSTKFPSDEQIRQFDSFIARQDTFDPKRCLQASNRTLCPRWNLGKCEQCIGIVDYREKIETCAMCSEGNATANFFDYSSTFLLHERKRLDRISVGCQGCHSLEMIDQLRQNLTIQVDFDRFLRSAAPRTGFTSWILSVIVLARFSHPWSSVLCMN